MKNLLLAAAWTLTLLVLGAPGQARAAYAPLTTAVPGSVPTGINFQGRLEQDGFPVTADKPMTFRVFDALAGGNLLWTSAAQNVIVKQGLFNAVIPLPLTALTGGGGGGRFLEVQVEGTVLSPREQLNSVPYAMVAKTVEGAIDVSTAGLSILPAPGGTVALFISSVTGNLGFGTSSPSTRLHLSSGTLTIDGNVADSIVTTGRVGIGTTNPLGNLHIKSNDRGTIWEASAGGVDGKLWDIDYSAGSNWIIRAVNDTYLSATQAINVSRTGMTINSVTFPNGNVGIGPANPSGKLHVTGGDVLIGNPSLHDQTADEDLLVKGNVIVDGQLIAHNASGSTITFTSSGDFTISGSTLAVVGGRVGIGTAAPQALLDVNGAAQFGLDGAKSTITASGNLQLVSGSTISSNGTLTLSTAASAGATGLPALFANTSGDIGLGTARPQNLLHLSRNTDHSLILENTALGADAKVLALSSVGGDLRLRALTDAFGLQGELAAFTRAGNMGLGTTSPAGRLHLSSGTLVVDGFPARLSVGVASFTVVDGLVGIGTPAPTSRLTVVDGDIQISTTFPATRGIIFADGSFQASAGVGAAGTVSNLADATIIGDSNNDLTGGVILRTGAADRLVVSNGGNVGIGAAGPASRLHLSSGTLTIDGNAPNSLIANGNVGIGTLGPGAPLDVAGTAQFGAGSTKSTFTAGAALVMASAVNITLSGGGEILGLPVTPSGGDAAASKAYVDGQFSGGAGGWVDAGTVVRLAGIGDSVGLGTADPVTKLHMSSGVLTIDGNASTSLQALGDAVLGSLRTPGAKLDVDGAAQFGAGATKSTITASGALSMANAVNITLSGAGEVLGLPAVPSGAGAAASKAYVDAQIGGGLSGWTDDGAVVRLSGISDSLGIGTLNPVTKLHMSSGVLTIDGNASTSLQAMGNAVLGSLRTPGAKLDVDGAAQFGAGATKSTFTAGGTLTMASGAGITVSAGAELTGLPAAPSGGGAAASKAYVDTQDLAGLSGFTDDGVVVRLTGIGDSLGVGTINPATKLDVVGSAQFGGGAAKSTFTAGGALTMASAVNITFSGGGEVQGLPAVPSGGGSAASKAYVDAQGAAGLSGFSDDGAVVRLTGAADSLGLGTVNPVTKLHMSSGAITIDGNASTSLQALGNAVLGGLRTPGAKLDVDGAAQFGAGATKSTFTAGGALTMANAVNITLSGTGEILGLPAIPSGGGAAASKAYVDAQVISGASGFTDDGAVVRLTGIGDSLGLGTVNPVTKLHMSSGAITIDGNASTSLQALGNAVLGSLRIPGAKLDVDGAAQFGAGATKSTFTAGGALTMANAVNITVSGGGEVLGLPAVPSGGGAGTSKTYVDAQDLAGLSGFTDDGAVVRLTDPANSLGLGTVSPASKIHLSSGGITIDGNAATVFRVGVSTLILTSNGTLGLGTANPATKLHLSSGTLLVDGDAANSLRVGVSTLILTSNGNLGLGTSGPDSHLEISMPPGGQFHLVRDDATTVADELLGGLVFSSMDSDDPGFGTADAAIQAFAESAHSGTDHSAYLALYTKPTTLGPGSAPSERMRINAAGNVGINTNSPKTLLHLSSGTLTIDGNAAPSVVAISSAGLGMTRTPGALLDVEGSAQFGVGAAKSTITATGALNMAANVNIKLSGTGKITDLAIPTALGDATNKSYVDIQDTAGLGGFQDDGAVVRLTNAADSLGVGTANPATKLHLSSGVLTIDGPSPGLTIGVSTFVVKDGQLGIGTAAPDVNARVTILAPSGNATLPTSAATALVLGSTDGTTGGSSIRARGTITGALADFGEYMPFEGKRGDYAPGDLLVASPRDRERVRKSRQPYDPSLVGIMTHASSFIAGGDERVLFDPAGVSTNRVIIALAGRVPVKVSAENGPIRIGDFLTSSSKPGQAMKATKTGRVIGIALEGFQGSGTEEGRVLCFINPHTWVDPEEHRRLRAESDSMRAGLAELQSRLDRMEGRLHREARHE